MLVPAQHTTADGMSISRTHSPGEMTLLLVGNGLSEMGASTFSGLLYERQGFPSAVKQRTVLSEGRLVQAEKAVIHLPKI